MRRISTLAVLDPQGLRVKWRWGPGEILGQHHPRLLDDDHLLIFDNGSPARPWSRIIEYSPAQDRIVWEYAADPPESFYSNSRGSAQRLPNGNVLVTNSTNGEVFEVTRDGEVVWRFLNPRFRKRDGRVQRETIFRMTRIHGAALESLPPLSARSDGARD